MEIIIISEEFDGMQLKKFVRKNFPQIPLSGIFKILRLGKIKKNGKKTTGNEVLKFGDEIKIFFDPGKIEIRKKSPPVLNQQKIKKLDIIFENEKIFAINKPAGMPAQPGSKIKIGESAIEIAEQNFPQNTPHLVHRIDRETSGVLLFAKNGGELRKIIPIFSSEKISKKYLALVFGNVSKNFGKIEKALSDEKKIFREAKTQFQVLQKNSEFSFLEVEIFTGRKHQIRRHFSEIGYPVIGDKKYGNFKKNRDFTKKYRTDRHFLHAASLQFCFSKSEKCDIFAPLPKNFRKILEKIFGQNGF